MFLPLKFLNVYCKNKKIFFPYIYLAFKIYNEVAITVVMVSIIIVAMILLTMVAIVFLVMVA